ncbi:MAG: SGNH/GDSL hydrolase family protein [Planctomycetota bacterium]|nr:SGNH/GDSL hydrolase family protein [Planctomycetota bacterium]
MPLTYLALGDSYTIGESVEPDARWPIQLFQRILHLGFEAETPEIIAQTGWTTDELQQAVENRNLNQRFDLVSLLIGVNNQYRGRCVKEFGEQVERLIATAVRLSESREKGVIVLSIPDWGCTPFAEDRDQAKICFEIDEYNREKKDRCQQAGVTWVNITDLTRRARDCPELTAEDGLHPSKVLYGQWVDRVWPILTSRFEA